MKLGVNRDVTIESGRNERAGLNKFSLNKVTCWRNFEQRKVWRVPGCILALNCSAEQVGFFRILEVNFLVHNFVVHGEFSFPPGLDIFQPGRKTRKPTIMLDKTNEDVIVQQKST